MCVGIFVMSHKSDVCTTEQLVKAIICETNYLLFSNQFVT